MRDKLRDKVQCLIGNRARVQEDALAAVALAALDFTEAPYSRELFDALRERLAELRDAMQA